MLNDKVMLLGVAGLAAVATAGWMRQPQFAPAATTVSNSQPPQQEFVYGQTPTASALYATGPVSRFSSTFPAPVSAPATIRRPSETVPVQSASVRRAPVAYDDRPVAVQKTRSMKERAMIIGGGAAAGAAIGGLAGGGKGALIGALGGGAAGAVYDHVTRNKQSDPYGSRTVSNERRADRSTMQRAAIIGGGAAAGAVIGGAADGGKGAAIGALGGGAAGYVYDRMTRNN